MLVVYKYDIEPSNFTLNLPKGAQLLCANSMGQLDGAPKLWALVDPDQPTEPRYFITLATGEPLIDNSAASYVASFCVEQWLVFHLFELFAPTK
jgi:hypothetical protein